MIDLFFISVVVMRTSSPHHGFNHLTESLSRMKLSLKSLFPKAHPSVCIQMCFCNYCIDCLITVKCVNEQTIYRKETKKQNTFIFLQSMSFKIRGRTFLIPNYSCWGTNRTQQPQHTVIFPVWLKRNTFFQHSQSNQKIKWFREFSAINH